MPAGQLRERLIFDKRPIQTDDGYGNVEGEFVEQFECWARVRPLKGGEQVLSARLTGTQPVIITVRRSSQTALIKSDWRARDARTGTVYAITSPASNMDEKKQYLDIMATTGAAP